MVSIGEIEAAARAGSLDSKIDELLELIDDPRARARVAHVAEVLSSTWTEQPEAIAADLYARTLDLEGLAGIRARWHAELDARGPWLRALQPVSTPGGPLAELRNRDGVDLQVSRPRFLSEHRIGFFAHQNSARAWSWARGMGFIDALDEHEPETPLVLPCREDPELAPLLRPKLDALDPAWPDLESASVRRSTDGARIFVYGPRGQAGAFVVLDAASRELELEYELERPILAVLDRPGTDEFLVTTTEAVIRFGLHERRTLRGRFRALAWSPSGRYLCTVSDGAARVWDLDENTRPQGAWLGLSFSPRGTYLLHGSSLFTGIDGQRLADLDVGTGQYFEGGPPAPSLHLGEELLLWFAGGMKYWVLDELAGWTPEAGPVAPRRVDELHGAHWDCVAYDVTGTCLAMASERTRDIELIELPSGRSLATIGTELDVQLLALSSTAELLAALGEGRVEVRRRSGELVFRGEDPFAREQHNGYFRRRASKFGFSADDRLLGLEDPSSGTVIWNLVDGSARPRPAALADFDALAQGVRGWSIHDGKVSSFIEQASGVRLAISLSGPWLRNPARECIVCPSGHFELRGLEETQLKPGAGG